MLLYARLFAYLRQLAAHLGDLGSNLCQLLPTSTQLESNFRQLDATFGQLGTNLALMRGILTSSYLLKTMKIIVFIGFRISFKKSAFMQFWDPLEATLDQLRVKFCKFEPKMDPTGAILGPFSANLGPTWACLAPSWRLFGRSLIHFGAHGGCKHGFVQL